MGGGHTESCVPDGLLSKAALSSSTPDLNKVTTVTVTMVTILPDCLPPFEQSSSAADTDLVLQSAGDAGERSIPENLNLIGPLALNNVRAKAQS